MPAGLPCGMPGMALEIEGAMQQAAQPLRQLISGVGAKVELVFMSAGVAD
jgi:hypothetical protein